MTSSTTIHWLAGLLEGEGCFDYSKRQPKIQLRMTDRDVVERAAGLLHRNAKVYVQKEPRKGLRLWKDVFCTYSDGIRAAGWMMTLYSLMGARRKAKILEVLTAWRVRKPKPAFRYACPSGHPYSERRRGRRHCRWCDSASKRRGGRGRRHSRDVRQLEMGVGA